MSEGNPPAPQPHNPYAPPAQSSQWSPPSGAPHARQNLPSVFRPAGALGWVTQAVLWGYVALAGIAVILSAAALAGVPDLLHVLRDVGAYYVLAWVVAVPMFCIWFYRVYANLIPLGREKNSLASWWAPASFFVPIVNLFFPYQLAWESWVHSTPPHADPPDAMPGADSKSPAKTPSAWLVGFWWIFCLGWAVLGIVYSGLREFLEQNSVAYYVFNLVLDGFTILAAVCGALMVRGIDRRQLARHHALMASAPPPPMGMPYAYVIDAGEPAAPHPPSPSETHK